MKNEVKLSVHVYSVNGGGCYGGSLDELCVIHNEWTNNGAVFKTG